MNNMFHITTLTFMQFWTGLDELATGAASRPPSGLALMGMGT